MVSKMAVLMLLGEVNIFFFHLGFQQCMINNSIFFSNSRFAFFFTCLVSEKVMEFMRKVVDLGSVELNFSCILGPKA